MTQSFVSESLGVGQSAVADYESGRVIPPPDKLARLADLFGVTTDYLLGREPEPLSADDMLKDLPNTLRHGCRKEFDAAMAAACDDIKKLDHLRKRLAEVPAEFVIYD